jgi:hypothetical protein
MQGYPQNILLNTEHDLDLTNWEWENCLAFPVSRLNDLQFSLKPYKWIRYATEDSNFQLDEHVSG